MTLHLRRNCLRRKTSCDPQIHASDWFWFRLEHPVLVYYQSTTINVKCWIIRNAAESWHALPFSIIIVKRSNQNISASYWWFCSIHFQLNMIGKSANTMIYLVKFTLRWEYRYAIMTNQSIKEFAKSVCFQFWHITNCIIIPSYPFQLWVACKMDLFITSIIFNYFCCCCFSILSLSR